MKTIFLFVIASFVAASISAQNEFEKRKKLADEVFIASGAEKLKDQMLDQLLKAISQQHRPGEDNTANEELINYFKDNFKLDSIRSITDSLYFNTFTASELKQLKDIYQLPVWKKYLDAAPQMMQAGQNYGRREAQRVIKNFQEYYKKKYPNDKSKE